jgi:hypothetical protein
MPHVGSPSGPTLPSGLSLPLPLIQRQLGYSHLSTTGTYRQGIDTEEIISSPRAAGADDARERWPRAVGKLRERTRRSRIGRHRCSPDKQQSALSADCRSLRHSAQTGRASPTNPTGLRLRPKHLNGNTRGYGVGQVVFDTWRSGRGSPVRVGGERVRHFRDSAEAFSVSVHGVKVDAASHLSEGSEAGEDNLRPVGGP